MTTTAQAPTTPRLHTIGAICRRLQAEFPDISISKIRYLEDQGLLSPKRTRGGYRLFSEDDVDRLETILRLQRDEFLPLRVIRQADTAAVCARLITAGLDARHLRKFVTAAGNQADLLEALVPKLRSRNPEARRGALEDLHGLAELTQELSQLLFWRTLRHRVAST